MRWLDMLADAFNEVKELVIPIAILAGASVVGVSVAIWLHTMLTAVS